MRLTHADKVLLKSWGFTDQDMFQIEEATKRAIYTTYKPDASGKLVAVKIKNTEALSILGRSNYLSGISRSAFHYTSERSNGKGEIVFFDTSKMFR